MTSIQSGKTPHPEASNAPSNPVLVFSRHRKFDMSKYIQKIYHFKLEVPPLNLRKVESQIMESGKIHLAVLRTMFSVKTLRETTGPVRVNARHGTTRSRSSVK